MTQKIGMYNKAESLRDFLVTRRRELHQIPELGFHEFQTATRIVRELTRLGCSVKSGVGKTGIVGEIGSGKPCLALRADMDALPITEENDVPYRSLNPGTMHACGHDAHMAILLGVISLLQQTKFPGKIRFLFQPSEETSDEGGKSGAARMIEDGAMVGVDAVFGLHVDTNAPVGKIILAPGPVTAGSDTFYLTVTGKGGHAAYPHRLSNPIYSAAHLIHAIHSIVQRKCHPAEPAVIGISTIHGGQTDNVVPEKVELSGTIRYRDSLTRSVLHQELHRCEELCRAFGDRADITIEEGYPPVVNNENIVALISSVAQDLLGNDCFHPARPDMGAEDFSYFSDLAPGVMFGLGCRIEKTPRTPHHPLFDIDEDCLPIGAAILAEAALRFLNSQKA